MSRLEHFFNAHAQKGAGSDANVAFGEQDFLQEKEICAILGSIGLLNVAL